MEKYITKNGIKYELRGEQYYPMLEISEQTNHEIGKYGHLHLDFIKKHRRGTYTTLLTEGRLYEHLHSIDEQAHEQIDIHIAQMAKQGGLDPQTIKKHAAIFRSVLNYAMLNDYITQNVADIVPVPRKTGKKSVAKKIDLNKANEIIKVFENEELQPVVRMTLMYGFRRSELLGLKWSAVDFDANKIYVEHTIVKYTSIIAEDDTKTDESEAGLPLYDDARELLLEVKAQQEEYRKLFGKEYIENDYIFKHPDGTLYRPDSLTRSFQRVLKRKGCEVIRFHDLRHATASILYAQDWKPVELAQLMRHSNMRTTLQIYTHLSDDQMAESCKSLNGLFSKNAK